MSTSIVIGVDNLPCFIAISMIPTQTYLFLFVYFFVTIMHTYHIKGKNGTGQT